MFIQDSLDSFMMLFKYFPEFNNGLLTGVMVFARVLGLFIFAPILSRKDFPLPAKISFALFLTIVLTLTMPHQKMANYDTFILCLVLNTFVGSLIGFVALAIFEAISAAGDMMNMQMGLSSSVMFDPNTRSQSSPIASLFSLVAAIIFIHVGGLQWMISALERSFDIFGVFAVKIPMEKIANIDYLVRITSNILFVGLQLASPVLLATLGMDIILGIISKTAPQVNVFQLSFLFKPCLGAVVIIVILPILMNVITDYFLSYARIF